MRLKTSSARSTAWNARRSKLRILIENTAGSEFSMGGTLEQVGDLLHLLDRCAPVDVCLDTCHTHVAGYDLVTPAGYEETDRVDRRKLRDGTCDGSGTATTPRHRAAASWIGMNISATAPSGLRPFAACCATPASRIAPSSRKRPSMNRATRCAMSACCGRCPFRSDRSMWLR